jgi:hypothetical protein
VHAIGDSSKIDEFIEIFVEQTDHAGFHRVRDARRSTGPADVYLAVKTFTCDTATREGEGSVRDYEGKRVKRKLMWVDAICTVRVDVMSKEMKRVSTFYGKGEGTSPRVEQLGDEETEIARGVAMAGDHVSGPHPPDTVFLSAMNGKYDVVMAMYHDQGLIPVKTLAFDQSVNVTLGLPWLRVSVDHGTAFDIAGKGIADAAPMEYAIRWASEHAR